MSTSICIEVPVFLTKMSEEIWTLEGVSVEENANAKGLKDLVIHMFGLVNQVSKSSPLEQGHEPTSYLSLFEANAQKTTNRRCIDLLRWIITWKKRCSTYEL